MRKKISKLPGWNAAKKIYYGAGHIRRRIQNALLPSAHIVLYHRIAIAEHDPHRLCVSPENFRSHLDFFKKKFHLISLQTLVAQLRTHSLQDGSLVITLDDGYADNLHDALPILEACKVPATVFLTTGYLGAATPLYLTLEEAKRLSTSRYIEIGAHTLTHPKLAKISEKEQFMEISESKRILKQNLQIPITSFAYPFGGKDSFDKTTVDLVKKAGYHYACANIHERVRRNADIYALPRFVIRNWTDSELETNFKLFI